MLHPELSKAIGNERVKAALKHYRSVYAEWMSVGSASGYAAGDTPLHHAERELNKAVEEALYR